MQPKRTVSKRPKAELNRKPDAFSAISEAAVNASDCCLAAICHDRLGLKLNNAANPLGRRFAGAPPHKDNLAPYKGSPNRT
ncbi:Uncharacterised protein [Acinetobacter baumannii]|nr:Uncharacterised protein [Acinetobacter baumannii]